MMRANGQTAPSNANACDEFGEEQPCCPAGNSRGYWQFVGSVLSCESAKTTLEVTFRAFAVRGDVGTQPDVESWSELMGVIDARVRHSKARINRLSSAATYNHGTYLNRTPQWTC